jgi:hypothetical protein
MMTDGIRNTGHFLLCLYSGQAGFMFLFSTKDRECEDSFINLDILAMERVSQPTI